jgi:hypothetical protein
VVFTNAASKRFMLDGIKVLSDTVAAEGDKYRAKFDQAGVALGVYIVRLEHELGKGAGVFQEGLSDLSLNIGAGVASAGASVGQGLSSAGASVGQGLSIIGVCMVLVQLVSMWR